jgi:hypothetical protein
VSREAAKRRDGGVVDALTLPFDAVFEEWERRTDSYRDLVAVRAFALYDRFFLLTQLCGRKDMLHPWLYERCREVELAPDGYLDLWAREHYKSTIITFGGSIQEVLNDPEITIGIFSHTKGISRAFVWQIKQELELNVKLQQLFPDVLYENPADDAPRWSLDAGLVVKRESNPKEATIEGHGLVDGMPTAKHFKLLIYDDVVTEASVTTAEQVTKTTDAWELSDNLGVAGGPKWHIGTRYSYGDTYEEIIKRGSVIPRIHTATATGLVDGPPVLLTPEVWRQKQRDQGPATIACQMMQNPLSGEQRMFDVADLKAYEIRPETLAVYILIDPARSVKKESAETAMMVVGLDYAMNKYLLDGYVHRMALQERWQRMASLVVKWRQAVGVQSVRVGYEAFGAQADVDYFAEQMRLTKVRFEIAELTWPRDGEGSKVDRVQRLGPDLRSGKLFVPYPTDEKRLTATQRKMLGGYEYRIAKPIRRVDGAEAIYDLTEKFRTQLSFFPFTKLKDTVDAFARIYDMEPRAPTPSEPRYAEPEHV